MFIKVIMKNIIEFDKLLIALDNIILKASEYNSIVTSNISKEDSLNNILLYQAICNEINLMLEPLFDTFNHYNVHKTNNLHDNMDSLTYFMSILSLAIQVPFCVCDNYMKLYEKTYGDDFTKIASVYHNELIITFNGYILQIKRLRNYISELIHNDKFIDKIKINNYSRPNMYN